MSTQPDDTQPTPAAKRRRRFPWFSLLALIAMLGLGLLGGYNSGIGVRQEARATLVADQLRDQYDLAVQDIQAGNYEAARQRLTYIIQQDPNFPGVTDLLAELILRQSITPSPTASPTPTMTPTIDPRGPVAVFAAAEQALQASDWEGALALLDALRKNNPDYRTVDVDGMYYFALRNLGMQEIANGQLEGGIYRLNLAERFGPLDGAAIGQREGARMYLTAATFWEVDWSQAAYYFGLVYQTWPGMWDRASGRTAADRYREALIRYGDALYNSEAWCDALTQYQTALQVRYDDQLAAIVQQTMLLCSPPTPTPLPTATPTETPTSPTP